MMLPSGLLELPDELELPPRSAIELAMNDEMTDCAGPAPEEEGVPVAAPEELEASPVSALSKL
jgi:hypothetical protein